MSERKLHTYLGRFNSEQEAMEKTGLANWSNLIMAGYGFHGDADYAQMQFELEFARGKEPIITTFSEKGIVIASLVLTSSDYYGNDIRAYGVQGVVVAANYRGQNLGSRLYEYAVTSNNIQIIHGNTKNPAVVISRARALHKCGMRTFLGHYEVTSPSLYSKTDVHKEQLLYYLANKNVQDVTNLIIIKDTDILPSNVPDLKKAPDYVQEAFQPIVIAQLEIGDNKTACLPILSIKETLLNQT